MQKALNGVWSIDFDLLLLKIWSPLFDTSKEKVDKLPLWVCLSGLPSKLWDIKSFREMGNVLGLYLATDMSFESTDQRYVARILVLIDIQEGLEENVKFVSRTMTFVQKLDYESVPFCCRQCHHMGHVVRGFPLVSQGQSSFSLAWKSKKRVARQEGLEPPLVTNLQAVSKQLRTSIVELGLPVVVGDSPVLPRLLDMVFFQGIPSQDHLQHSLSSRVSISPQGMSLKLLPSLSVVFNSLSLLGQSWSKPMRGLAFSNGGLYSLSFPLHGPSSSLCSTFHQALTFSPASISSKLELSGDYDSTGVLYQLSNRSIPALKKPCSGIGGLGLNHVLDSIKKGRGRKYHLLKAK